MSIFLQDGRRGGHLRWAIEAIDLNLAEGVVINPFHTPRVAAPYHRSAAEVADGVATAGAQALFDPSTHAAILPGSNDRVHYDTWQLWSSPGIGLGTDPQRLEHLERVFARQGELDVPHFAPTLPLDNPTGADAVSALRTAQLARSFDPNTWQPLAGRRSFWRSGSDLDAYVGQLAALRAPTWVLTVVNDIVPDNAPDMDDVDAFAGLCRTVHSLSERSRVIVSYADYGGLPAVAAGASAVGTGWDRGMRFLDPLSFQLTSDGIRIPASYVTQGGLLAVLRRDVADAIERLDTPLAARLRGGRMPQNDAEERIHHLAQLGSVVSQIDGHGADRQNRVATLRSMYESALDDFNDLLHRLPRGFVNEGLRARWLESPFEALRRYAEAEGLW